MKSRILLMILCAVMAMVMGNIVFAQGTIKIKLWTFIDPTAESIRSQAHNYVHQKFMEKYPNIKLEADVIGWKQLDPMLIRAVKVKQPPEVSMFYSPSLMLHVNAGSIQPLDRFVQDWTDEQKADFIAWDSTVVNGHKYGFHYDHRVTGMVYRKDILDKAGFAYPESLGELGEQAEKLTDLPDMMGFINAANTVSPINTMEISMPIAYSEGGRLLHEDGRAAFNSPAFAKTVNYWKKMVYEYKAMPSDVALMDNEAANAILYAGKGVFHITCSHRVGYIRDRSGLSEKEWQFGPIPSFQPNVPSPTAVFGWVLAIPTGSKEPEAAWKFIEHFTSPEMQAYLAEKPHYMPVRKSAFDYPWFETPEASDVYNFFNIAKEKPLAVVLPEHTTELWTYISEVFERVIMEPERIDALAGLNEAAEKYNKKFGY